MSNMKRLLEQLDFSVDIGSPLPPKKVGQIYICPWQDCEELLPAPFMREHIVATIKSTPFWDQISNWSMFGVFGAMPAHSVGAWCGCSDQSHRQGIDEPKGVMWQLYHHMKRMPPNQPEVAVFWVHEQPEQGQVVLVRNYSVMKDYFESWRNVEVRPIIVRRSN